VLQTLLLRQPNPKGRSLATVAHEFQPP
ncbi:uncharacterized protein METZ01_LOCUS230216, partial [marine metagenome]